MHLKPSQLGKCYLLLCYYNLKKNYFNVLLLTNMREKLTFITTYKKTVTSMGRKYIIKEEENMTP